MNIEIGRISLKSWSVATGMALKSHLNKCLSLLTGLNGLGFGSLRSRFISTNTRGGVGSWNRLIIFLPMFSPLYGAWLAALNLSPELLKRGLPLLSLGSPPPVGRPDIIEALPVVGAIQILASVYVAYPGGSACLFLEVCRQVGV